MLLEDESYHGLSIDALVTILFLEHERNSGLGMDALVRVCSWKRIKIADVFDNGYIPGKRPGRSPGSVPFFRLPK